MLCVVSTTSSFQERGWFSWLTSAYETVTEIKTQIGLFIVQRNKDKNSMFWGQYIMVG